MGDLFAGVVAACSASDSVVASLACLVAGISGQHLKALPFPHTLGT